MELATDKTETNNKPSVWACARHWLLTRNHSLKFLKDMKTLGKQGWKFTEKEKQGIVNCYNARQGQRLQGMFAPR